MAASVAISGLEELESQLLPDLGVEDLIDPAHAALAQLFDDLVAAGKGGAGLELADGRDQGFRRARGKAFGVKRVGAAAAEPRVGRIFESATRALHGGIPYFGLTDWL